MSLALLALPLLLGAQRTPPSPEVHADRTVTFRLRDPGATKVELSLEGSNAIPMTKDSAGIWSCTTRPLAPDIYGYSFSADGETRLDPQNPVTKPNLIWQSNAVLVPGSPAELWEVTGVPHGTVHHHFYASHVIGDQRDFYVYTPPGYKATDRTKYPVLYLLHGYSDTAIAWSEVGKAHLILDNLIAQRKAKPMLVVMPLGYGVPNFATSGGGFSDGRRVRNNYDSFRTGLLIEVIPQVEKEYRVAADPRHRAIAGLSMGGAETLYVGLNNLDKFSYIGAFSAGGLVDGPDQAFPNFSGEEANRRLKELWVSCGTEDGLITPNRAIAAWLKRKGAKVDYVETPGRHAWMVWRRNLAAFASKLF
ncbi:esterase [Fimbriimonas ginsengisoli]|uniref:Putative esterase n=1 Tax=Fimbriimonas ginsengisoli Gsoil 348 TaxID=661478 RepID=A0A068NT84_FIMGI|nr:alpha/beta hydrolase-fold protein [Fimbriimonas ginsengisoli]AIE85980.1 putative esterase [Fimbriimonas ginsengisoli Gsoil 348]